jgi:hypothetical protein
LFTKEDQELVEKFEIPKPVTTNAVIDGDPYDIMLSYIYSDQHFDKIKEELTPKNVFSVYTLAHCLRVKKLVQDLETVIVDELLNSDYFLSSPPPEEFVQQEKEMPRKYAKNFDELIDNCMSFYLDAIKFNSEKVTKACEELLVKHFHEIVISKNGQDFINKLPMKYLQQLLKRDELCVRSESVILECVQNYIKHREEIEPDKTPEEIKAENDALVAEGKDPLPDPIEEEKQRKEDELNARDDAGKIEWKYQDEVDVM